MNYEYFCDILHIRNFTVPNKTTKGIDGTETMIQRYASVALRSNYRNEDGDDYKDDNYPLINVKWGQMSV